MNRFSETPNEPTPEGEPAPDEPTPESEPQPDQG